MVTPSYDGGHRKYDDGYTGSRNRIEVPSRARTRAKPPPTISQPIMLPYRCIRGCSSRAHTREDVSLRSYHCGSTPVCISIHPSYCVNPSPTPSVQPFESMNTEAVHIIPVSITIHYSVDTHIYTTYHMQPHTSPSNHSS